MTFRENPARRPRGRNDCRGFSLIELIIVILIITIISAIALPRLIDSRRMLSSAAMPREVVALLRYARQQAISQMTVHTFRYDHLTKTITITNNKETGITYDPALDQMVRLPGNAAATANVVADVVLEQYPLTKTGIFVPDILVGRPNALATVPLDDGVNVVTPTVATNQIIIAFQPDGSVVDALNRPLNRSLFMYNRQIPDASAFAISVLGSTGRIKPWRYDVVTKKYVE
jgi:prepilin-type N-terminal cleavage/methylation domain-containing protein